MSYSPSLASVFNRTTMRDPAHISTSSGMCSMCTADCIGSCEIGLSAVRGMSMVYPSTTGDNQIASEKNYPVDYSHFNVNGRAFGAQGADLNAESCTIFNVKLERTIGSLNPVKIALPLMLPALIKLNWQDYFGGAAMAGVCAVIGEDAITKDPSLAHENGMVSSAPWLREVLDAFNKYDRGYGQIILQVNYDDDRLGVPEYAIRHCGAKAIEFKFGQSAKGTQPAVRLLDIEAALKKQAQGYLVHPDPSDAAVQEAYAKKACPAFHSYGRLPIWSDEYLLERIDQLRDMGMTNVYFKMAGFDPEDLEHSLRLASKAQVDMITFDGAGGGSGYSPCKMMNEWCLPTVVMESILYNILQKLKTEGLTLPHINICGGFSTEDQIYKALALGAPYISTIGVCRASMAAAMSAKKVGDLLKEGKVPPALAAFGSTKEELFSDLPELRGLYGSAADQFSTGAIGVYSYLNRLAFGLRHFAALNRKFDVACIERRDIFPLTRDAKELFDWA